MPYFCGFPRGYPHYPQLFHNLYPPRCMLWICMWTIICRSVYMFTHMTNVHKFAKWCMFVRLFLCVSGCFEAESPNPKRTKNDENVKSPKKMVKAHEENGGALSATPSVCRGGPLVCCICLAASKKLPANLQTAYQSIHARIRSSQALCSTRMAPRSTLPRPGAAAAISGSCRFSPAKRAASASSTAAVKSAMKGSA